MNLTFDNRPLGFAICEGYTNGDSTVNVNAIISKVDDESNNSILVGRQIMEINGKNCVGIPFDCITNWLKSMEMPLDIVFARPSHVKIILQLIKITFNVVSLFLQCVMTILGFVDIFFHANSILKNSN